MEEKVKSIIEWRTGEPKEECECLVTLKNGNIVFNDYCCYTDSDGYENFFWSRGDDDDIIAWCPLNEIEPYKE